MPTALDKSQRSLRNLLAGAFVFGLLVAPASMIACGGKHDQQGPESVRTSVEAAVMRDFSWGENCGVLTSCSEVYRASDVDCHPTGETLRGTPVYWCSVSYDDNRATTGACVNVAGGDLAMSGPVIQEEHCNASVAKARTNRFFTEADEVLP
jgi:hypothetical protein